MSHAEIVKAEKGKIHSWLKYVDLILLSVQSTVLITESSE